MKIAINGFGRIGRAVFKIVLDHKLKGEDYEIVAINDLTDTQNLEYLLRYDTVYGRYERQTSFDETNIIVDGVKFPVFAQKDPLQLPWKDLGVDVVIESTGVFTKSESARAHLTAGAKKVILTAPAKDDGFFTAVLGANGASEISQKDLVSNASCTTNNITPLLSLIDEKFGIEKSAMTTIHAYTANQSLTDSPSAKDFRRGRAAAQNIVPSSTGAADATAKVLPALTNKFDGVALRVPVVCGSISDLTILLKVNTTIEDVNKIISESTMSEKYKGIIAYTKEQLVSSDILKTSYSCIVDGNLTRVIDGNLIKILAWYDNEWGYSNRVVDLLKYC